MVTVQWVPVALGVAWLAAPLQIGGAPGSGSRPPAAVLAEALQRRYDSIRDFTATFVHTYEGGLLRTTTTERGTVAVKKPGKMRWEYVAPERKLFVSDGRKLYSYIPADRQVIVGTLPEVDDATTAVLFLAGKGDLRRDFTISYAEPMPAGTYALRLAPRHRERDYDWLLLIVDARTLELRRLVARDLGGGTSTLSFTNLKENQGLSDRLFEFTIPRGVDVITSGPSER